MGENVVIVLDEVEIHYQMAP